MQSKTVDRRMSSWLALLLGLFVFRVLAQLVQAIQPVPLLPDFDAWQSGALPYPLLLLSQVVIIAVQVLVIRGISRGSLERRPGTGSVLLVLGGIYLALMLFRLVAGLSFAAGHPWLGVLLPTLFHLVLALFVISVGVYHRPDATRMVPWLIYPAILGGVVTAHLLLRYNGIGLTLATYLPVTVGGLLIIAMEMRFPYRREWLPARDDIVNDAIYLVLVQMLLPRFLGFLLAISLLGYLQSRELSLAGLWPGDWPLLSQALLMMVSAELPRYWVHRLAHNWNPLWRLHAVHHSPHKLYWLNVGRFHPLEKALQFLFDSLPFILLGVSEDVLALYFVFYSVNGFFQHCNIQLRLGWLNYLISGPELHRWHHSKLIRESNTNYGNNLIVWDLAFGTWFLPRDTEVGDLGLLNRQYPLQFTRQLATPFVPGLDKTDG